MKAAKITLAVRDPRHDRFGRVGPADDRCNGTDHEDRPDHRDDRDQADESGTVGANTGGAEQFKLQGGSLDAWHAGDRVSYTATEAGGVKTITRIEKQSSGAR